MGFVQTFFIGHGFVQTGGVLVGRGLLGTESLKRGPGLLNSLPQQLYAQCVQLSLFHTQKHIRICDRNVLFTVLGQLFRYEEALGKTVRKPLRISANRSQKYNWGNRGKEQKNNIWVKIEVWNC